MIKRSLLFLSLALIYSVETYGQDSVRLYFSTQVYYSASLGLKMRRPVNTKGDPEIIMHDINEYKFLGLVHDTLSLQSSFMEWLMKRPATERVYLINDRDTRFKRDLEVKMIFQRMLMRTKDSISVKLFAVPYQKLRSQKKIDKIDGLVPLDLIFYGIYR